MEKTCGGLPTSTPWSCPLAMCQHPWSHPRDLDCSLFPKRCFLAVDHCFGHVGRFISGAGIHYFPRLWTRFLLQKQESQRCPGLLHRHAHLYPLPPLEVGTRGAPRHQWRFGQAWDRGRLDDDSGRIPHVIPSHQIKLSTFA